MKMIVLLNLTLLAACGDGGDDDGAADRGASGPLYAVFTQVDTPEGRTNYLGLTSSLGSGEIDLSTSLQAPGRSRFYAPEGGGFFAIGSGEDLTIRRYDVTEAGRIAESGRVSFAGYGVTSLGYYAIFFSPTRAYYIDPSQGQIIMWNPSTMEVVSQFDLPPQLANGFEGHIALTPFFRFPVVRDRLLLPVAHVDFEGLRARDVTGLAVVDTVNDRVLSYFETDRCAAATELAFDDNGDVYFGTSSYYLAYNAEVRGVARPGCIMRIRAGETAFDADYLVRLTEFDGQRAGMELTDGATPGVGYVQLLDERALPWASITDVDSFWGSTDWEWWRVDLRSGTAVRDANLPNGAPFIMTFEVEGKRFVVRIEGDRSRLYELSADGAHRAGFAAPGNITGIARVR
jgi:hypothetical protein